MYQKNLNRQTLETALTLGLIVVLAFLAGIAFVYASNVNNPTSSYFVNDGLSTNPDYTEAELIIFPRPSHLMVRSF